MGVNFTSTQKQRVPQALIAAGVDLVEGGWLNETNPTDLDFFKRCKAFDNGSFSRMTAFGMTRRPNTRPDRDPNLAQLIKAGTKTVTIFGKSWPFRSRMLIQKVAILLLEGFVVGGLQGLRSVEKQSWKLRNIADPCSRDARSHSSVARFRTKSKAGVVF